MKTEVNDGNADRFLVLYKFRVYCDSEHFNGGSSNMVEIPIFEESFVEHLTRYFADNINLVFAYASLSSSN